MTAGIYRIYHKQSGKMYIGSSVNLAQRKVSHFAALKRGDHHSPILQAAYNKYGRKGFEFEVIITCPPDLVWYYEEQFLKQLAPKYNAVYYTGGYKPGHKVSKETRRKQSASAKARGVHPNARKAASRKFKGEGNPSAKLNAKKVLEIKHMIERGMTNKEIVQTCKCAHKDTISNIRRGVQWASVTGWGN